VSTQFGTAIEVSWFWDWVPPAGRGAAQESAWIEHVTSLFDSWAGEALAAARARWPADAPVEFPAAALESAEARGLLARADELPGNCRLIWGAGFIDDRLRWLPLLVLVEFREALPQDPAYLMGMVGVEGFDDDVREPTVDYVTTEHGDGIRVLALARGEGNAICGRVNAALRLEGAPVDIDVLLTTRVYDMGQFGVIGPGLDTLMNMIATQFAARPGGDVEPLRFKFTAGRDLS
jgi:hypothetical protein